MRRLLVGYRDNMRVEIGTDVPVSARTVAELRALSTWPDGLVLDIHIDLDPRKSVVRVERAILISNARAPPPDVAMDHRKN